MNNCRDFRIFQTEYRWRRHSNELLPQFPHFFKLGIGGEAIAMNICRDFRIFSQRQKEEK
jgi:hypothetical protein